MIVVLTGGTGGSKLVQGFKHIVPPEDVAYIVNTGDDMIWWGLHISPDVDSILYALADLLSKESGWGVEGDTFQCLEVMRKLGAPGWFQLGDRDLALHLTRTQLITSGKTLSETISEIARRLQIKSHVFVMSDARVETRVQTSSGELSFQEYFVRERYQIPVQSVRFEGAETAKPSSGLVEAILQAEFVILAPSNPVTSIGPILAVPGIRDALKKTSAIVAAISPIIGDAAVSGPAGELMKTQGWPVSILGVAQAYADFLDLLIADAQDENKKAEVERLGIRLHCAHIFMCSHPDKVALARETLQSLQSGLGCSLA